MQWKSSSPHSGLVFRPENPPLSVALPSPHVERDRGWIWWWDNLTILLVYLSVWAVVGQAIPKDFHILSFDSSVTFLWSNRVIGLPGLDWYIHGISPLCQPRSERKLFCLFAMVSSNIAMVLLRSSSFWFHNENSLFDCWYRSVVVNMLGFLLNLLISCLIHSGDCLNIRIHNIVRIIHSRAMPD